MKTEVSGSSFNGEIYNYQDLRTYLLSKGHSFKTDTDTEVIVHLYEELGEACVTKLQGMFAFAIWDQRQQVLFWPETASESNRCTITNREGVDIRIRGEGDSCRSGG